MTGAAGVVGAAGGSVTSTAQSPAGYAAVRKATSPARSFPGALAQRRALRVNVTIYGDGDSTLIAGTGTDYLAGGGGGIGGNTLVAGSGAGSLYGGGGANTFVFNSVADNNPGTSIGDFVEGTDKINLTGDSRL